jgi:Ca2+/Na+ antiporter
VRLFPLAAPETIFFINALMAGYPGFAVGAVSGSSIVVCTVALGACLFFGSCTMEEEEEKKKRLMDE